MAVASFLMQVLPTTAPYGDVIRYIGLIFPSFCVTHAILLARDGYVLFEDRAQQIGTNGKGDYPDLTPWSDDLWDMQNLKSDMIALVTHIVFGILFLALIESPLMDCCYRMECCKQVIPRDEMDMDEDVAEEEDRIARQVKGVPTTSMLASQVSKPDVSGDPEDLTGLDSQSQA